MSDRGPTYALSSFLARTTYESLPAPVIERAKVCVLDSLGCVIGGSSLQPARILDDVMNFGGPGEATLLSDGSRVPALLATYLNSSWANMLDFDDTYLGHPGATIIPAALAFAERARASGKALLLAVVTGYEVHGRIAQAIKPTPARYKAVRGFAVFQTFGAMAAAGKILGLPLDGFRTAFGLAGTNAPVPALTKLGHGDRPLSWLKNNFGWAAMGGAMGADLASRGFVGNRHVLDGDAGFWVMAGSDRWDEAPLFANLGQSWEVMNVSLKPYSCCRFLHSTVDAMRQLVSEGKLGPHDIERVEVAGFNRIGDMADYSPANVIDAQFSLPYVVAMTILGVPTGWAWFSDGNWNRPEVAALMRRVHFHLDADLDRRFFEEEVYPSRVTIQTRDGRHLSAAVTSAKGSPSEPLSWEELEEKFRANAEPVVGPAVSRRLMDWARTLEADTDVAAGMRGAFQDAAIATASRA